MTELLHCPFCGGKAESYAGSQDALVRCEQCPADMGVFDIEAEAIAAWNTRAASGIETEGQDGETRLGAKHESPTEGDAQ